MFIDSGGKKPSSIKSNGFFQITRMQFSRLCLSVCLFFYSFMFSRIF
jgi:hypothetical protein